MNIRDPNIPVTLGAFRALQDEVRKLDAAIENIAKAADALSRYDPDFRELDRTIEEARHA